MVLGAEVGGFVTRNIKCVVFGVEWALEDKALFSSVFVKPYLEILLVV